MSALGLLVRLRAKAMIRKWGRGIRTPRGLFLAFFVVGFLTLMASSNFLMSVSRNQPASFPLLDYGPFVVLGLVLFNLLTTSGERAFYFSPSEVDFLFTAPFTRRQLLLYKLAGTAVAALALAFFLTLAMGYRFPNLLFGFVGLFLTMFFVSITGMLITLAGQLLSERLLVRTRIALGTLFAAAFLAAVLQASRHIEAVSELPKFAREIAGSLVGTFLFAPLNVFIYTIGSETWGDFVVNGLAAAAVNFGLISLILVLDVNFIESASRISQRIFTQAQRMKKTGGWSGKASKRAARWRLAMLPHWRGTGPLAWRQLLTALRTGRSMLLIAAILIICVAIPLFLQKVEVETPSLIGVVFAGLVYISLIFSLNLPMGFRAEIDHIQVLKTLPVSSMAIATGQLVGPLFVVTLFQWGIIAFVAAATGSWSLWWLGGASLMLPMNVVVFGVANALFLLYPVRIEGGSKDIQFIGVMAFLMTLQAIALMVVFAGVAAVAAGTYFATGSYAATFLASLSSLIVFAALAVKWTADAFGQFDVSQKTD